MQTLTPKPVSFKIFSNDCFEKCEITIVNSILSEREKQWLNYGDLASEFKHIRCKFRQHIWNKTHNDELAITLLPTISCYKTSHGSNASESSATYKLLRISPTTCCRQGQA